MCNHWRIPATCVISCLSAKSELQNITNAKCDTEEHYVGLWFSLEDAVQQAKNGLRFHVERGDRLLLHDSLSWLTCIPAAFFEVFHIVSMQTWPQKWKLKDDSIFSKHVECLLPWKGAQTKFPTARRVVNELWHNFSKTQCGNKELL